MSTVTQVGVTGEGTVGVRGDQDCYRITGLIGIGENCSQPDGMCLF